MNRVASMMAETHLRHCSPGRFDAAGALLTIFILCAFMGSAQPWQPTGATSGPIYYTGGNVGIGTTAPSSGHVQIQTDTNSPAIYLVGNSLGWGSGIQFYNTSYAPGRNYGMYAGADGTFHLTDNTAAVPRVSFKPDGNVVLQWAGGNVGIGTTNPQYMLAVNGVIGGKEVVVTTTGWPDYVFKPGYQLPSLESVASYVKENQHLPGIPSEAEVAEKGIGLGDMQAKVLAKVEELTLQLIAEHDRNRELEVRLISLEKELAARGRVQ
jgi:hypothetical protein